MPRNNSTTYNSTHVNFDLPLWNPQQVLKVAPGRCSGITLKGLPCRQPMFAGSDVTDADGLLEQLCYLDPRKGLPKEDLELLAELTLCKRWHRDKRPQGPSVVSRWRCAIRDHVQSMPPLRRTAAGVGRKERDWYHVSSTTRDGGDSRTQSTTSRSQRQSTQSSRSSTHTRSVPSPHPRRNRSPSPEPEERRRPLRDSSTRQRRTNVSEDHSPPRSSRSRTSNQSSPVHHRTSRPRDSTLPRYNGSSGTSSSSRSFQDPGSARGQSKRRLPRTILTLTVVQETYDYVGAVEALDSDAEHSDNESAGTYDDLNSSDDSDGASSSDEDSDDDGSDDDRQPASDQSIIQPNDSDSDSGFGSDSDSDSQTQRLTPSATTATPSTSRTPSPTIATPSTSRTPSPGPRRGQRQPLSGECPICQELFHDPSTNRTSTSPSRQERARSTAIVHCRAQCGQNFHAACMREWSAHQQRGVQGPARRRREVVTCPYCRARWQWAEDGEI